MPHLKLYLIVIDSSSLCMFNSRRYTLNSLFKFTENSSQTSLESYNLATIVQLLGITLING